MSLIVVGLIHPGVERLQGLYLGVGTALVGTGSIALGGQVAVAPWVTDRLSHRATRRLVACGSLVLVIGGGTLVGGLLRYGLTANTVAVGGVGAVLFVLALVSARVRLQI